MTIRVVELFAGVGGFRVGLEGFPRKPGSSFEVVWSNQYEPSTKTQHANLVYKTRWPKANHSEKDIQQIINEGVNQIPDHDMLVAGFPCQDFSVANSLKNALGLKGSKGQLWWCIHRILKDLGERKPKYLLLENVDRLINSPSNCRGRDFAMILKCLEELGYGVEWRIINAADYGMPQRRKRIFILGIHRSTSLYEKMVRQSQNGNWLVSEGIFACAFPVASRQVNFVSKNLNQLDFAIKPKNQKSVFLNTGIMTEGKLLMLNSVPEYQGLRTNLGDILIPNEQVPEEFFINIEEILKEAGWKYQKSAKKIERINRDGIRYTYSEGSMKFPDPLNSPSRTIITGEGGSGASRIKHVILTDGRYRRLTPIELERLNMLPDNHTKIDGISDTKRAFLMGNALVTGVVQRIGESLKNDLN